MIGRRPFYRGAFRSVRYDFDDKAGDTRANFMLALGREDIGLAMREFANRFGLL
jgi:UTP--glucose-1-phosphate uridylyltransferase